MRKKIEPCSKRVFLPLALKVLRQHRNAGDRVLIATGATPILVQCALDNIDEKDVEVVGSYYTPCFGGFVVEQFCHAQQKMRMIDARGYGSIEVAYSDSDADLPLLQAARKPVVVNPKATKVEMFQRTLPAGTPMLNWGCPKRSGQAQAIGD